MTAVARLLVNQHPLLIGDLLISGPPVVNQVRLPLVEVNYHSNVVIGPTGLRQKIAIVSDDIVIGWAGKYSTAADVVNELKERCEVEHFNSQRVEEYFLSQPKSVWKDIGLAGFAFDSDRKNLRT